MIVQEKVGKVELDQDAALGHVPGSVKWALLDQ
jgi:hypothetical protein